MKNSDTMAGHDIDACPVHGSELAREYNFGLHDATVYVWGCGCAACCIGDSLDDAGTYHRDYHDACGRARLGVAIAAVK